jgi:putative flippase GtrA
MAMTSVKQPEHRLGQRRKRERRISNAASYSAIPASATDIMGWIAFFRQLTFIRYLVVSVCALVVDIAIFLILIQMAVQSTIAAAVGYIIGIAVHWFLSSRKVFQDRVSERGSMARNQQKAMFVISALLGLGTTTMIVGLGEWLDADVRLAKLAAIAVSFLLTYMLRNVLIFRPSRTA